MTFIFPRIRFFFDLLVTDETEWVFVDGNGRFKPIRSFDVVFSSGGLVDKVDFLSSSILFF